MNTKLAIFGGTPVRETMLPYGRQHIDNEDIKAVADVLKSDFVTCGPKIDKFEKKIADYVGAKYAAALSSGTAGLHAACFAAGIKEGDEVITTPMTFAASANCVLYMGAKPVFADILQNTYNIDPEQVESKITSKTKAIIAVDYTGQPTDLDEIIRIAQKHNLIVIDDAAHALGAEYKGEKIGSICDMTMFSFHPVKHITTGEGGIVTTNDAKLYERLRVFRTHGITRNPNRMVENHGPWYYEMLDLGFNYRITDFQAALGISQIEKLPEFLGRRRRIADEYNKEFSKLEELIIPYVRPDVISAWHIYVLRLNMEKLEVGRKQIFEAMQAENIGVNVHYVPVYYHPYYRDLGYKKGICQNAEKLYEEIITLPLYPAMSDDDKEDVINAVKKVVKYFRK